MTGLLDLKDIEVRENNGYRLKDIQLSINVGEKIALLGRSGAGKSTLIAVANGSLKPNSGKVSWRGIELKFLNNRQRNEIGTLWQDLRLVEELTVSQNINIGALAKKNFLWAFYNLLGTIKTKECLTCLQAVGLDNVFLTTPVQELSGGQRQRVAIARLLMQQAELLLADEPLSNLDPTLVDEVLKLFLNKRSIDPINIPKTCLISLHRPDLITNFTRVVGLKRGRIIFDCQVAELTPLEINSLYKDR